MKRQKQFESERQAEREIERTVRQRLWDIVKVIVLFLAGYFAIVWIALDGQQNNW